ncbi:Hsp70 family protein [Shewanella sp. SM20]|uniref:Hsp70 family protein n=1 Tax=Shewanella TaxID=22 RepID=UPI0021D9052C|nr:MULTISPECIES: Hsp70 family protein [unclassified Shewanella]MCU8071364.1 Hsp70 family protein [Shewanella sp. SM32]MCU8093578.1 Hsp70 family protein [Shewanella sp. SM20]
MKNYVGIDLGTTNSAICSYDGSETRIWKSPEQNDVTPSAIYIDRRGNKYVGKRAYDSAPHSPDNSAMLFKRVMGTSTPIQLSAVNLTKTPEECSAEVLKVLFGYLPEEIRNDPDTGTVITVPAAFNQMQKDATMQAASMAGLGNVALMQEPVAAVMSVMRARNTDGMFLIYDLGGGTLDIAIAESIGGRVNLLAHGGIAMCGGRDFDRVLVDNVVRPWLLEKFDLPDDFSVNPSFKSLIRLATWATERAKIELSAREEVVISLSETETRVRDLNGDEIYLDIQLKRETYDNLIAERVAESISSAREALNKAGLSPHDLERIVFVGGPTNYKPLRDKVSYELGIPGNTDVNPMTAVAEGASLFAESIDWGSQNRSRKNTRGQISSGGGIDLSFNYIARTPDVKAKIAVQLAGQAASGSEFQIDSEDTGWTSGRMPLKHGTTLDVTLSKSGENTFKVFVFDAVGGPLTLEQDKIVITRTAATVDAIPASHSVGIEVLEKLGGRPVLDYLIRFGDSLPRKGKKIFKAAESLKSGASGSLNLKLWEGEIEDPITDNRPIGVLKISGSDFDDGVIPAGADLECEFEILDSGNIVIEVSVPCIGGTFHSGRNFYSRQEGQIDYTTAAVMVVEEGERTLNRIDEINKVVDNPKLEQARQKLESATELDPEEAESEESQEAMEKVFEARKLLAQVRREHLKEIRQIDLNSVVSFFEQLIREHARPSETSAFDNLVKTAQRSIDRNDNDFEHHLDELRNKNFEILWRQDWFVVERFKHLVSSPHLFADKHRFDELTQQGMLLMRSDDIEKLRAVVAELSMIQIGGSPDNEMFDVANIIRG